MAATDQHVYMPPAQRPALRAAQSGRAKAAISGAGISLGRIRGIEIRIDWSLLIIFALIAFNLGANVFPAWHPDWSAALCWAVAVGAAIAFFASVLLHELSHALVALRYDIPVQRITLFLFGGIAQIEREPPSPKSEFWMAIVGPFTSFAIAGLATLAGSLLAQVPTTVDPDAIRNAFAAAGPLATLLLWLGPINLTLAIFNVLPGFPLDGGRVLRAMIWGATGDLTKATRWATRVGQLFAWAMMALGVVEVFSGALGQGIWLVLIGWFLNNAARGSYQQAVTHQLLSGVRVSDVMRTQVQSVPSNLPLDVFVRDHVMTSDQQAFPVESNGSLRGIACLEDVRKIPQSSWPQTTVESVMTPADRLPSLAPEACAEDALDELARRDIDHIPVLQGERLVGLVGKRDLVKWLALRRMIATEHSA